MNVPYIFPISINIKSMTWILRKSDLSMNWSLCHSSSSFVNLQCFQHSDSLKQFEEHLLLLLSAKCLDLESKRLDNWVVNEKMLFDLSSSLCMENKGSICDEKIRINIIDWPWLQVCGWRVAAQECLIICCKKFIKKMYI